MYLGFRDSPSRSKRKSTADDDAVKKEASGDDDGDADNVEAVAKKPRIDDDGEDKENTEPEESKM